MNLEKRLKNYANLIVKSGCVIDEGSELFINAPVSCVDFTRMVVKAAYEQGAKAVYVTYRDDVCGRMSYDYSPMECFENFPEWSALRNNSVARKGASTLTILSDDPNIMKGVDTKKLMARTIAAHKACKEFYDALDFGKCAWCIVGAASPVWAKTVFPSLDEDSAMEALWDAILSSARITEDDNAVETWKEHQSSFDERKKWMNEQNFVKLHYKASNGTDFKVGLMKKGRWEGGGQKRVDGTHFFPNIPTEEIYTSPNRTSAEGIVYSSLPLIHNGSPVKDFWLRFKEGKVVDFDARVGRDVLKSIIKTDEGSARLGECALIPFNSPIQNLRVLFYETLYDENASCHLALGKGFPDCFEGGFDMTSEELLESGLNNSATHVDFMIGTKDLNITGISDSGKKIPIFINGNWA